MICQPIGCQNPASYEVSLRFYSPLQKAWTRVISNAVVPRNSLAGRPQRLDSIGDIIWSYVKLYEQTHSSWVAHWPRQSYEQLVREFVRKLDVDCFENRRMYARAANQPDTAQMNAIFRAITSRTWLC